MLILALLVLAGCRLGRNAAAHLDHPPIILIVIDTLRADHVGCYGYERTTTPNLDAFAETAVRFTYANGASSWTVPSMASLFTGVYPWRHGIHSAQVSGERGVATQPVLNERFLTLAETLQEAGYVTFGVSANGHMAPEYGMGQGFDNYQVFDFANLINVQEALKDYRRPLRQAIRRGNPYFLYIHYFDPHHPYMPRRPYWRKWRTGLPNDEVIEYNHAQKFMKLVTKGFFFEHPDQMELLVDLYDSEIAAVDAAVGKLLGSLPGADHALIIITADHGEAFGDHHNMIHGEDLYTETLRVPLLLRRPRQADAGRVIDTPVSLVDIYPTLAAVAGAASPNYLDGLDLQPIMAGEQPKRLLYGSTRRAKDYLWSAIIGDGYKWVWHENADLQKVFSLSSDPLELHDLGEASPELRQEFREKWRARPRTGVLFPPEVTGKEISEEKRRELESLGYL